eukprot:GILK01002911.1.p1 GENE.GILK01002911.1~~GILK01002911.1.p1  ORF type:complete len:204 (+),score=26.53 GILK01002911.1:42-653(+)
MLARWQDDTPVRSGKRIIPKPAQFEKWDFLKAHPTGADLKSAPSLNETKFGKGFHRRNYDVIAQDKSRIIQERNRVEQSRTGEEKRVQNYAQWKESNTFNLLTGEGVGREKDYRRTGLKAPDGATKDQLAKNNKLENDIRMRTSELRFFLPQEEGARRKQSLDIPSTTVRKSAVLGYVKGVLPSLGVKDNFMYNHGLQVRQHE